MKNDFELLKKDTEVIYNGIRTSIEAFRIYRPSWIYDGTDEEENATLGDFYDSTGTHFYELDVEKMTPDMIDWDSDYVRIDTNDIPSYLQDLNEIVCLSDVDIEHDIHDLEDWQLKELREKVCIGSIYISDYNNPFFIERSKLSGYCQAYEEWLNEGGEDSPEWFSYYIRNFLII